MHLHKVARNIVVVSLGLLLSIVSVSAAAETKDPWEGMNRGIFRFNDWTDSKILRPTARFYTNRVPSPIRRGVGNVFDNVGTPGVAINQMLQGKPVRSLSDTARFLVNSTVGLVGIFDVASKMGLEKHQEDFGQTLGVWGAGSGNYMVLPFLGSSSVRHSTGQLVDAVLNPLRFLKPTLTRNLVVAVSVIDLRASLLGAEELIVGERYIFLKDAHSQRREYLINDGVVVFEDFDDDGFGEEQDF